MLPYKCFGRLVVFTTTMPSTSSGTAAVGSGREEEPAAGTSVIAAVEGGGTSFKVAVCQVDGSRSVPKILHRTSIDSSHDDPQKTLQECAAFLERHRPPGGTGYAALALATFGPVGVNPADKRNYGRILKSTPKAAWRDVDLLGPLERACRGSAGAAPLEVRVDTDVNAPAVAEYQHAVSEEGSGDVTSVAYVTVGTGVGVGLVVNRGPVHGRMHPEGGHVKVQPLPGDKFAGYSWGKDFCPFEGVNTVEGLACSVSLTERLQQLHLQQHQSKDESANVSRSVLADLPDDHEVWDHAANALACLCVNLILTVSIEKIVFGGGIMSRNGLIEKIRALTARHLNGYLELPDDLSGLITLSTYGQDAGLVGAMVLAQRALTGDDVDVEDPARKAMKREAFKEGLWYGAITGAIAMGLACKYFFFAPRPAARGR